MTFLTDKLRQAPIVRNSPLKKLYWPVKSLLRTVGLTAPVSPTESGVTSYRRRSAWGFDPVSCPCDRQFVEYLQQRDITDQSVFHFGTGTHHIVGCENQKLAQPNQILAITASHPEHEAYVKLALQSRGIEKYYKVLFNDIYTLDARNLPSFDVVSLFHLCEFYLPEEAAFVNHDDRSLLALFLEKLNPNGILILYDRSNNWPEAKLLIEELESSNLVERVETYQNLWVYRRKTA
jgi:SAM-dependent methyltransferase